MQQSKTQCNNNNIIISLNNIKTAGYIPLNTLPLTVKNDNKPQKTYLLHRFNEKNCKTMMMSRRVDDL
ncbi:MAG: hypothetical protein FWF66_03390 [Candidatus Bathyarchaeota archaeon]|nr:hypothetical protein [Candidatus Termiticorpusculum sp.]